MLNKNRNVCRHHWLSSKCGIFFENCSYTKHGNCPGSDTATKVIPTKSLQRTTFIFLHLEGLPIRRGVCGKNCLKTQLCTETG